MAFDPVTLELAKKYTDKHSGEGGSGGGLSQSDADKRYLQLTGGTMNDGGQRINVFLPEEEYFLAAGLEVVNGDLGTGISGASISFFNKRKPFNVQVLDMGDDAFLIYEFFDDSGETRPIRLNGVADPTEEDDATNKRYVDEQGENAVKKSGEKVQSIGGSLRLKAEDGSDFSFSVVDKRGSSSELTADHLYFERYGGDTSGKGDFSFTIYAKTKEGSVGADHTVPVLEFEDGMSGHAGVILAGVYTPVEDYDAANKKYVDDSIDAAVKNILEKLGGANGE